MGEEDKTIQSNENTIKHCEASVKWYSPTKGYGFLSLGNNLCDVMIHFSTLDKIGCPYVKAGDRVICEVASGTLGLYVFRVIEVKFGSPEPRALSSFTNSRFEARGFRSEDFNAEDLKDIEGVVKWYNPDKGYGFILPDDGTREIFLHFFVLRSTGYKDLQPGTRVLAKTINSERGPEACMIRILYETEKEKKVS